MCQALSTQTSSTYTGTFHRRGASMIAGQAVDYTRWGLKIALIQMGVKQAHIAKSMGKDQAWVSKVVNGWIDPSDEDTARMASVLNVGVDELKVMFANVA